MQVISTKFKASLVLIVAMFILAIMANAQISNNQRKSSNAYRNNFKRVYTNSNSSSTFEIRADGTLWGWGDDSYGQLGDGVAGQGNTDFKIMPVQISTDNKWISLAAGTLYTIAIKSDGTLWGWGDNSSGQLGNGTTDAKTIPTQIGTDNMWVCAAIVADHNTSFAIKSDGTLWAWGENGGMFGDGTSLAKSIPTQVGTDNKWVKIAVGATHTIALKSDGTLWAWGWNNRNGQIGDGTTIAKTTAKQIGTDNKWVGVAAGYEYSAAIKSDGTLWAWGENGNGQLGDGTTFGKTAPIQVGTDTKWVSIVLGTYHSVALKSDGTLWAWGLNAYGQLGDGTSVNKSIPTQIGSYNKWVSISAANHTLGVKSDGTLWSWGNNGRGQIGDGTTTSKSTYTQVSVTDSRILSVSNGGSHSLTIKTDGTLWAWGNNDFGQLGDGTTVSKLNPTQISTDTKWVSIVAGDYTSLAIDLFDNSF